jgi:hypothetical protein
MSEGGEPAAESASERRDGRLPYEKPAVTWEQPLEVQPSLMGGCEKVGGTGEPCNSGISYS